MTQTQTIENHSTQTADYQLRTEYRDGKKYLVVPVVMMVEGVHCGSRGPVYHPTEVLSRAAERWENHPVTIYHPQNQQKKFISAEDPEGQAFVVGHIKDAYMDQDKLKAEAWLEEQKLIAVSPTALSYIRQNRRLEVSVGIFTQETATAGEYNGEQYEAVAQDHQPDHLALLPGEQGACSWQDGCGVRTNQEGGGQNVMADQKTTCDTLKELVRNGYVVNGLNANQQGFRDIMKKIQAKLDSMDNEVQTFFLQELYDDRFVYLVRGRQGERFFQQDYNITDNNEVEFVGEPIEVRKKVEFVEVNKSTMKRTKYNNKNHNDMEHNSKTPSAGEAQKVVQLINNEQTRFDQSDYDWLSTFEESKLDKMFPEQPAEPEVNREQAVGALSEDLKDISKLLELLDGEVKEKVQTGLNLHQEERDNLIKSIQANTDKETWPEDDLKQMDINMLRKLNKSVAKADYSGQAAGPEPETNQQGEQEMLLPAGIELEDK